MKGYLAAFVEVSDRERYSKEYGQYVRPLIAKHSGSMLINTDQGSSKEGALPRGKLVVIEFPDMATAEAFYNDPEYQPYKAVRQSIAPSILGLFPGE